MTPMRVLAMSGGLINPGPGFGLAPGAPPTSWSMDRQAFPSQWDIWYWAMSSPALLPSTGAFVCDGFDTTRKIHPNGYEYWTPCLAGVRCLQTQPQGRLRTSIRRLRRLMGFGARAAWLEVAVIEFDLDTSFTWLISTRPRPSIPPGTKAVHQKFGWFPSAEHDWLVSEGTVIYTGTEAGALAEL